MGIRYEEVLVTPELAREWLARPAFKPRAISRLHVSRYRRAIAEDRWRQPGLDPIAWTPKGERMNGGHRLTAVATGDVAVLMLVAWDVPEEMYDVIDRPRARTAAQFLTVKNAKDVAAAARVILWYAHRRPTDPTGAGLSFDMEEIVGLIEDDSALLQRCVRDAGRMRPISHVPVSTHAAVLYIARAEGSNEDRIEEWVFGLTNMVGLTRHDPRRALIRRLAGDSDLRRNSPAMWMLTVRAFNAWMEGREVKQLKYEEGDAPPTIVIVRALAA